MDATAEASQGPLLAAVLAASRAGVVVFGADRRIVLRNPAFLQLLDLPDDALPVGTSQADMLRTLIDRGEFANIDGEAHVAAMLAMDRTRPNGFRRVRPNGRILEAALDPLPDGGYVIHVSDVTQLVAAEQAAAERGRLLDTVLANSRTGFAVFGHEDRLVLHNAAYAELCGLAGQDLAAGLTLADLMHRMRAAGEFVHLDAEAEIAGVLAHDRRLPRVIRRRRPNGSVVTFESVPLPDGFFIVVTDVTELVATREEADHRARLLEGVLDASRAGIAVYGPDHRLLVHNAAYAATLDLAPAELPAGIPFASVIAKLEARGEFASIDAAAYLADLLGADHTRPHLRRRIRPTGQVLEFASDPLPGGGFIVTVNDVTALARAEAEARERATTLESVLGALPQGVSLFGPDRRARLVNPAYRAIMGEAAVRPGETMEALIERRRRAGEYGSGGQGDAYADLARHDHERPARRRRTRPDGTTIDVRTASLPDGGHISVVTDVTLEVAAQAEIERRTALLDLMMAHVHHGMVLFDAAERVVLFNTQAETLTGMAPGWLRTGRSREEIIRHLHERGVYGSGAEAELRVKDYRARDPRRVQRLERSLPDGRVIELHSVPLPDGGFVVAIWDVSWRREAEAALRAAKETAEAASRAKSSFLANVSHELRTPLNSVIGFSEAIVHEAEQRAVDPASGERIAEYAHAVNDAGRHLLALINDILDVARIESGRVEISEGELDLGALVTACRRVMEPAARAAGVRLEADLPASLPRLLGDERRLRQVLLNLLSNAVKFTPSGGFVRVIVRSGADGGLVVTVRDSGVGIAPENIPRAFEPFAQIDTPAGRKAAGSGLGLFLSRALAGAHGGTLELESVPGHGTSAILRLPPARVLGQAQATPLPLTDAPEGHA